MKMDTILITGGTGFLGRNLAMVLKRTYGSSVILAGRNNELNNYASRATGCTVVPMDVTNMDAVRETLGIYRPSVIIHAAATKYVDLAELYPNECIDINVRGTQNLARAAMDKQIRTVIGISTDKAALPCSGMYHTSKAMMERLFTGLNGKSASRFCCVRFGNIAWSTGSVLPIWRRMLEQEGLIRTTGADMRRFMFSVHEAIGMVCDVLSHIDLLQGTVLAKKMKAVGIGDLLTHFLSLYGGRYERTAARIGDKPDEYMVGADELQHTTLVSLGENDYYLIDSRRSGLTELTQPVWTATEEKMSEAEVRRLIDPVQAPFI
jgi:FlaA1/EpsC-like NDP-sugar epimerase